MAHLQNIISQLQQLFIGFARQTAKFQIIGRQRSCSSKFSYA